MFKVNCSQSISFFFTRSLAGRLTSRIRYICICIPKTMITYHRRRAEFELDDKRYFEHLEKDEGARGKFRPVFNRDEC